FPFPGSTANSSNPVMNIWRGTWAPPNFTPRTVSFALAAGSASSGQHSTILVQHGVDPGGAPRYAYRGGDEIFGTLGGIQIGPDPWVAPCLLAAAIVTRRRRPHPPYIPRQSLSTSAPSAHPPSP